MIVPRHAQRLPSLPVAGVMAAAIGTMLACTPREAPPGDTAATAPTDTTAAMSTPAPDTVRATSESTPPPPPARQPRRDTIPSRDTATKRSPLTDRPVKSDPEPPATPPTVPTRPK